MDNVRAFFANLSKNTSRSKTPDTTADKKPRSALKTAASTPELDKLNQNHSEVRFQTPEELQQPEEVIVEKSDVNETGPRIAPKISRLIDQLQNRKSGNENGDDAGGSFKKRLSNSLSHLEQTNRYSTSKSVNADPTPYVLTSLDRTHSEGDKLALEQLSLSDQQAQIVQEEFTQPHKMERTVAPQIPKSLQNATPIPRKLNHTDFLAPERTNLSTLSDQVSTEQHSFDDIFHANLNWLKDEAHPPTNQIVHEGLATDIHTPTIVLTSDNGQQKLLNTARNILQGKTLTSGEYSSEARQDCVDIPSAFRSLDVENRGFVRTQKITDYWMQLGVSDTDTVFQMLGFDPKAETIQRSELTKALEEHLVSKSAHSSTHLAATLTILNEWRQARSTIADLMRNQDQLERKLQELHVNREAEQSSAQIIAVEYQSRQDVEALRTEHQEQTQLIREQFAKSEEANRTNLLKQMELNQRLQTEVAQKSKEHNQLRQELENSKTQLLQVQSLIQQTQQDLIIVQQTNQKLEEQLEQLHFMKDEYARFMEYKNQLDELVERVNELSIPDNPSQPQTLQQALDTERNQRLLVQAVNRLHERLNELAQKKIDREERQTDLQNVNQLLMEKIESLQNKLLTTREELRVENQLSRSLQTTVTEMREENDRLEKYIQQFHFNQMNLEKTFDELKQQVAYQAEQLTRAEQRGSKEHSPSVEHTLERLRTERVNLEEYQSELESTLQRQAEQLAMFKSTLQSIQAELEQERSGSLLVIQQHVDSLLQYCGHQMVSTANRPITPTPRRRTTYLKHSDMTSSALSPYGLDQDSGNTGNYSTPRRRYKSTATLASFRPSK